MFQTRQISGPDISNTELLKSVLQKISRVNFNSLGVGRSLHLANGWRWLWRLNSARRRPQNGKGMTFYLCGMACVGQLYSPGQSRWLHLWAGPVNRWQLYKTTIACISWNIILNLIFKYPREKHWERFQLCCGHWFAVLAIEAFGQWDCKIFRLQLHTKPYPLVCQTSFENEVQDGFQ